MTNSNIFRVQPSLTTNSDVFPILENTFCFFYETIAVKDYLPTIPIVGANNDRRHPSPKSNEGYWQDNPKKLIWKENK